MKLTIALPVYNEQEVLAEGVRTIVWRLREFGFPAQVVISDNGSQDLTQSIGRALELELPEVRYMRLSEKGKGRAIRTAWLEYPADFYGFMDIDLSAGLESLPALIQAALESGGIAYGSRSAAESKVRRSISRGFLSNGYRIMTGLLHGFWSDSKCGFKMISRGVLLEVMPQVADSGFFFDTELVLKAKKIGCPLREVPVRWSEAPNPIRKSHVSIFPTIIRDLNGLLRLKFWGT